MHWQKGLQRRGMMTYEAEISGDRLSAAKKNASPMVVGYTYFYIIKYTDTVVVGCSLAVRIRVMLRPRQTTFSHCAV